MKNNFLALCGALVGGALGYFAFFWVVSQGFYALVLPGGLLGIGAGLVSTRALWVAVVCGLLGLGLGLFTEYRFAPFVADDSLGYFLTHVMSLKPVTLLMIIAGGLIAFWMPSRRIEPGYDSIESGRQGGPPSANH